MLWYWIPFFFFQQNFLQVLEQGIRQRFQNNSIITIISNIYSYTIVKRLLWLHIWSIKMVADMNFVHFIFANCWSHFFSSLAIKNQISLGGVSMTIRWFAYEKKLWEVFSPILHMYGTYSGLYDVNALGFIFISMNFMIYSSWVAGSM